jgi:hypothetical protein
MTAYVLSGVEPEPDTSHECTASGAVSSNLAATARHAPVFNQLAR